MLVKLPDLVSLAGSIGAESHVTSHSHGESHTQHAGGAQVAGGDLCPETSSLAANCETDCGGDSIHSLSLSAHLEETTSRKRVKSKYATGNYQNRSDLGVSHFSFLPYFLAVTY